MDYFSTMLINNLKEALDLFQNSSLNSLITQAAEIRKSLFENNIEFCAIINCQSGRCSENCSFCSQSKHFKTNIESWELLPKEQILSAAQEAERNGAARFSLVSSGRELTPTLLQNIIPVYQLIKEKTNLQICASHGFIDLESAKALKKAGVTRYHHNLETSEDFYKQVCTSHQFQERIETLSIAAQAGLSTCSGGIWGVGESVEQRLKMAFEIRRINADSVPINILSPIKGTPLEGMKRIPNEELLRSIALYRMILPTQRIRIAGGRSLMTEEEQITALKTGIDALMIGNYLTTDGLDLSQDKNILYQAGIKDPVK